MTAIIHGGFEYLIKRLGKQELGSQSCRGGKANRGRYLLITKQKEVQQNFPALSISELNACSPITLTPIWKGANHTKQLCLYVYHNSKFVENKKNGRDEFRIYFPKELGGEDFYGGDIVVFRRIEKKLEENRGNEVPSFDFLIDWARPGDKNYKIYSDLLKTHGEGGNFLFYACPIPCFEALANSNFSATETEVSFSIGKKFGELVAESGTRSKPNKGDLISSAEEQIARTINSSLFHDLVLSNYNFTCAVTNEVIAYKSLNNLEAAHIFLKCHGGFFLPSNGISMRKDIHWAFDKGMFCINDDLTIVVAAEVKDSYLFKYNGAKINSAVMFNPDPRFLKYHRENVFGLFKTRGTLML